MKREGYIAIVLAAFVGLALYFAPRSPKPIALDETESGHQHAQATQVDSLETMVQQAVEMLQSGSAPPMQAIGMLRKVVEIDPDHGSGNFYLGYFSVMSGQYDKAVSRLETVLRVYPQNADAMLLMAQAKMGLGDRESAKEYAEKCLETNPVPDTKVQAEELLTTLNQ